MNTVIMMAGSSDEFYNKGFSYTKFLSEINGRPMLEYVIENLKNILVNSSKVIFIINKEDNDKYYLGNAIKILVPNAFIVVTPDKVLGAASASLLAVGEIDVGDSLLLVNGDQIIEVDGVKVIEEFEKKNADAGVVIFDSIHPRWSFVLCDEDNYVIEAAEKRPISRHATAGFYFYKRSKDYIGSVKGMMLKDAHVNGNFYICPAFNEMILKGKKIATYEISSTAYHSLMSPKKVEEFEHTFAR